MTSDDKPPAKGRMEVIDDRFAASRMRIEMILDLLTEAIEKKVQDGAFVEADLERLEKIIFLGQMNRAKTRDLIHLAPKKYQRLMSDAEVMAELRPVRDTYNFPRRGPRGPRDDIAPPVEGEEPPATENNES